MKKQIVSVILGYCLLVAMSGCGKVCDSFEQCYARQHWKETCDYEGVNEKDKQSLGLRIDWGKKRSEACLRHGQRLFKEAKNVADAVESKKAKDEAIAYIEKGCTEGIDSLLSNKLRHSSLGGRVYYSEQEILNIEACRVAVGYGATIQKMIPEGSAFARLPAGYEDVPEASGNGTRTIVNKEKGAEITVAVVQVEGMTYSAWDTAKRVARELECEVTVQGDGKQAGFENCIFNNQKLSVTVVFKEDRDEGKYVIVYANDKVTEEDIAAIFAVY